MLLKFAIDAGTGWLYDISESYDNSFYMMGICIIVSGVMLYPIPCIQRWRDSRKNKEPETKVCLESGPQELLPLNTTTA